MPGGRPPKPALLKALQGNAGKRKAPERDDPQPAAASLDAPDYLKGNALWLWQQLAPEAARVGKLTVLSAHAFAAVCGSFSTWRQYEGLCEEVGPQMGVSMGYRNAADRAKQDMVKQGAKFGFDPSIFLGPQKQEEDPFEDWAKGKVLRGGK